MFIRQWMASKHRTASWHRSLILPEMKNIFVCMNGIILFLNSPGGLLRNRVHKKFYCMADTRPFKTQSFEQSHSSCGLDNYVIDPRLEASTNSSMNHFLTIHLRSSHAE